MQLFFLMCEMSFCIFIVIKMIDELKNNIIFTINEILLIKDNR